MWQKTKKSPKKTHIKQVLKQVLKRRKFLRPKGVSILNRLEIKVNTWENY